MHRSGEGCPKQSAGSARQERRLRPTQKCACPCQAKVFFTPHIYRKECRKQVLFSIPRPHFSAENSSFCPPHFVLFFCPARYSGTASFLAATNFLLRSLNCHNVNLAWVPLIPKAWEYFQLLEPQTLVKTVGVIIFFVAPHLHCFYLQKRIPGLGRILLCCRKKRSATMSISWCFSAFSKMVLIMRRRMMRVAKGRLM